MNATSSAMFFFGGAAAEAIVGASVAEGIPVASGGIQYQGMGNPLFQEFAKNTTPIEGVLDVAVHGTPTSVDIGTQLVNHRFLANPISRNPQFTGQPVRLLSCNTGSLPNGFAQNLANKLGVPVSAPNNLIWMRPNGNFTIGAVPTVNSGSFINFVPGAH